MGRRSIVSTSLLAQVRAYYGLTQDEVTRWLGVSRAFVSHLEAGRKALPAGVLLRLTPLALHLPQTATPTPENVVQWPETTFPPLSPDARALVEARLAECRAQAARLQRERCAVEKQVVFAARWQAVFPALWALLPADAHADSAADARCRRWLLTRVAPPIPTDSTLLFLLRQQLTSLDHEIGTLVRWLGPEGG